MAFGLTLWQNDYVLKQKMYSETELAALAKSFRKKSGKKKAQLARELGVTRATMQDAEERPEKNLTKLRCRIIKACSGFQVAGPAYWLEKHSGKK
jgi:DNA-binding XRE family transcriptional regulator